MVEFFLLHEITQACPWNHCYYKYFLKVSLLFKIYIFQNN